ncbi:MAG: PIN domain-containing protein [Actinomycetota bacterium]
MTLVVDAAPLVAAADRRDRLQPQVESLLRSEPGPLVVTSPVTAEVDYMLGRRLGHRARLAFLEDLAAGRFLLVPLDESDYGKILELERQYEDLDVGLAELSTVVAAARYGTTKILTFDERHFRALRSLDGLQFTVLPADAAG